MKMECLLAVTEPFASEKLMETFSPLFFEIRCIHSSIGRAKQMNTASKNARGKYLWFVHADSRIDRFSLERLYSCFNDFPLSLRYLRLKFLQDGHPLLFLNSFFARFRSDVFKIPFGDQGFLLSLHLFNLLNGFDESPGIQEDHDLVWKMKHKGYSLEMIDGFLYTSGRKYRNNWIKVTITHFYLTWSYVLKQGIGYLTRQ